jgi:hypothetical protein
MFNDPNNHLDALQKEIDGWEQAQRSWDRQEDRMITEIRELKKQLEEVQLELAQVQAMPFMPWSYPVTFSPPMFPDEPGYREAEHGRNRPACFECIVTEENRDKYQNWFSLPAQWRCTCEVGAECKGPCLRHAHQPSFHPGHREMVHAWSADQAPCFECIDEASDEDPRPWCDCRDEETCPGPCRQQAHFPSFHDQKQPPQGS